MKIKIPLILACVSAIMHYLINHTIISIGSLLYMFFPYKQNPMTSFPPYWICDLVLLYLCNGIFIFSICFIIFRIFKYLKKKS